MWYTAGDETFNPAVISRDQIAHAGDDSNSNGSKKPAPQFNTFDPWVQLVFFIGPYMVFLHMHLFTIFLPDMVLTSEWISGSVQRPTHLATLIVFAVILGLFVLYFGWLVWTASSTERTIALCCWYALVYGHTVVLAWSIDFTVHFHHVFVALR